MYYSLSYAEVTLDPSHKYCIPIICATWFVHFVALGFITPTVLDRSYKTADADARVVKLRCGMLTGMFGGLLDWTAPTAR
jgi:hypothetical protein